MFLTFHFDMILKTHFRFDSLHPSQQLFQSCQDRSSRVEPVRIFRERKNTSFYRNVDRQPLKIQNGLFHTFCIYMYGIIHQNGKNQTRRIVVSYKQKYVHEVLVNCLVKLAQEKRCV